MQDRLYAYAKLIRLSVSSLGTLMLLWGTLWGLWLAGAGEPPARIVAIFLLGTFLSRSAGCIVNDLADRHFDGLVKRTKQRPLVTGEVSVKEAIVLACILFVLCFILVMQLNAQTILLAFIAFAVIILYPFTKRFFILPQAVLGIAFSSATLLAYCAITADLPLPAWTLFFANAVWALIYDTYYAFVDRDDDIPQGLYSSAIFSKGFELPFLMAMSALMLFFLVLTGILAKLGGWYYLGLTLAALLILYELYLVKGFDRERCFRAFIHSNWVGVAIWSGLVLNYLP